MIESNTGDRASLFTTEAPIKVDMPEGRPLACPAGTRFRAYSQLEPDPEHNRIGRRNVVMVLLHEGDQETAESVASLLQKTSRAEGRQQLKRTLGSGILVGVIAGLVLEIARRFIVPIWP